MDMKNQQTRFVLVFTLLLSMGWAGAAHAAVANSASAGNLQECADSLAGSLTEQLDDTARKVAVTNLVKLGEHENLLGAQLAEELTTALFHRNKKIVLVERRRLQSAISELQLSSGALFDESNARRIGKFVGADAVVVGSLFAADGINVVVRVIRVETGDVLAAASNTLVSTAAYRTALDTPLMQPVKKSVASAAILAAKEVEPVPDAGPRVVYEQDFKGLKEGTAPENWLGTEHFAVTFDKRGKPLFKAFEPGAARFVISGLDLPSGDFSVVWVMSRQQQYCYSPNMLITVGNLTAGAQSNGCAEHASILNNSRGTVKVTPGTPHRFELRREGSVFTLWMDGTRLLLARKTDFRPGDALVVDMGMEHGRVNLGTLYSVTIMENR